MNLTISLKLQPYYPYLMREVEIASRIRKYKPKKPLSKKYIYSAYTVIFLIFLLTIITKYKLLLFFFVTALSVIINYQTNLPTIRFNPDPEVFFSLLLTRICGFHYAVIMIFFPTLMVDLYTGRLDKDTFISYFLTTFINYVLVLNASVNFVVIGIVLVTIRFLLTMVINLFIGTSPQEIVFEHVLGFISNILIFITLGSFFINIFI